MMGGKDRLQRGMREFWGVMDSYLDSADGLTSQCGSESQRTDQSTQNMENQGSPTLYRPTEV